MLMVGGAALLMLPLLWRHKGGALNAETIKQIQKTVENESMDPDPEELPEGILGYISIPKLGICYAITEGAGQEQLAYYIGHIPDTAQIGTNGNCVLAGHRGGRNGEFFKHLDRLEAGDTLTVTDREGKVYEYAVDEAYTTHAYDNEVKAQDKSQNILTLLTCTDRGTRRLAVRCKISIKAVDI